VGQPVDERADVYAMGVMLWELIAGRQPFSGRSLTEIISKQFAPVPPVLPADAQQVPGELARLLAHMLMAQPEVRVASALEVREQLRRLRSGAEPALTAGAFAIFRQKLQRVSPRHRAIAAGAFMGLTVLALALGRSSESPRAAATSSSPASVVAESAPNRTKSSDRTAVEAPTPTVSDESPEPSEESSAEPTPATEKRAHASRAHRAPRKAQSRAKHSSPSVGTRLKRAVDSLFK
jgi:hypothetical protein